MRAKLKVWPPSGTTNMLKLQICWVLSQDESPEVTPPLTSVSHLKLNFLIRPLTRALGPFPPNITLEIT